MNKALRETQTLRAGCLSKAEPKISLRRRPPSRGAGRPKFYQLETVTTFTYKPSLVKIDARNFELSCRPTNKHTDNKTHTNTHTNPQTGPITIHCAAASLARSVNIRVPGLRWSDLRGNNRPVMRTWLQMRFDFDSAGVRREFDARSTDYRSAQSTMQ